MESKLRKANASIEYLVDALISAETRNYDGCCLRITLLGEDRLDNCNNISCYQCCQNAKQRYREILLSKCIVK